MDGEVISTFLAAVQSESTELEIYRGISLGCIIVAIAFPTSLFLALWFFKWKYWRVETLDQIEAWLTGLYRSYIAGAHATRVGRVEGTFNILTPANFSVPYHLEAECESVNQKATGIFVPSVAELLEAYNKQVLVPLLNRQSYCFVYLMKPLPRDSRSIEPLARCGQMIDKDGQRFFRAKGSAEVLAEAQQLPFESNGFRIRLQDFGMKPPLAAEVIGRNYAMITEEQMTAIEQDERYNTFDEILTVAALKRELDFVNEQYRQIHDSYFVVIETERAGRAVKIKWKFKPEALQGYDLLGFRRTGGFHRDQWSETENGLLVIQSSKSGETTEFLPEGESYYYTFFLKTSPKAEAPSKLHGASRFQITVHTKDETDRMEATIRRLEMVKRDEVGGQHISKALKELGSYVEFDNAFETTARTLEKQIESNAIYSTAEKQDKLMRLREVMAELREKYQQ